MTLPDHTPCVSIAEKGADSIEIVCREGSKRAGSLRWIMARSDAQDVVRWWRAGVARVANGRRSVGDEECGNVLVSMFSPSVVHVRVRDRFGKVKVVGYCFPRSVVEELDRWVSERATAEPDARRAG